MKIKDPSLTGGNVYTAVGRKPCDAPIFHQFKKGERSSQPNITQKSRLAASAGSRSPSPPLLRMQRVRKTPPLLLQLLLLLQRQQARSSVGLAPTRDRHFDRLPF
jgi:hypothetical protein